MSSFQPMLFRCIAVAALIAGSPAMAHAQTSAAPPTERDHAVVFELGWAGDWSPDDGVHAGGGTVAFEVTPIERWLEIEVGATVIRSHLSTETSVDLLLKKPWTISRKVEFMAGIGPELIHATDADGTHVGVSVIADLMVWPKRNVGWYLEPGYEEAFPAAGVRRGFGFAAGLLIGR